MSVSDSDSEKIMHYSNIESSPDIFIGNLGHLGFQRFMPNPALRPWVQCYWVMQTRLSAEGFVETLYPDGGTNLNFYFAPGEEVSLSFYTEQTVKKMHLRGQQDCLGIRFHPGGVFQLLGLSMPDWIGGEFSSRDLDFHPLQELRKRLGDLQDTQQRLHLIDEWLLGRSPKISAQPGLLQQVLPKLIYKRESIDSVCEQLALNRRKLERKFYQEVGLSPDQIKQLVRIKLARKLINDHPGLSLVEVAQCAGFYDQAHFIRQFKKLTGLTPGQYRQKKLSQKYNPH